MTDAYLPGGSTYGSGMDAWEVDREVECENERDTWDAWGTFMGEVPCGWAGVETVYGEGPVGHWECPECGYDNEVQPEE